MVRPQGTDGGTASSVPVAANILNKQSWTADKVWSLGLGKVLTTPNFRYYETFHKASDWDDHLLHGFIRLGIATDDRALVNALMNLRVP